MSRERRLGWRALCQTWFKRTDKRKQCHGEVKVHWQIVNVWSIRVHQRNMQKAMWNTEVTHLWDDWKGLKIWHYGCIEIVILSSVVLVNRHVLFALRNFLPKSTFERLGMWNLKKDSVKIKTNKKKTFSVSFNLTEANRQPTSIQH